MPWYGYDVKDALSYDLFRYILYNPDHTLDFSFDILKWRVASFQAEELFKPRIHFILNGYGSFQQICFGFPVSKAIFRLLNQKSHPYAKCPVYCHHVAFTRSSLVFFKRSFFFPKRYTSRERHLSPFGHFIGYVNQEK